jgi:hypothetical protein
MKSIPLSPRYWALATFLIPIAGAVSYGVWIVVSAANLASSTQSEELVRSGVLAILTVIFLLVPRPGTRAIAVAAAVALVLSVAGAVQFEVFRGR